MTIGQIQICLTRVQLWNRKKGKEVGDSVLIRIVHGRQLRRLNVRVESERMYMFHLVSGWIIMNHIWLITEIT